MSMCVCFFFSSAIASAAGDAAAGDAAAWIPNEMTTISCDENVSFYFRFHSSSLQSR